ncbi:MAG: S41 family peptidase [bacterium]|nr:S41 family peptidase [bacterium]
MKKIVILLAFYASFVSCEKALFKPDQASTDPLKVFDYLWSEVDKKYSYFDLKKVDWDRIQSMYRARLSSHSSEEELFDVLATMLKELKDDHTNLISPFNVSRYDVALRNDPNFNFRTIQEIMPNMRITGAFWHDTLPLSNVAYLRYGSFMSGVSDADLDYILSLYRNTKGLILDLRENGGGDIFNIAPILERFNDQRRQVGYFKTRNGPGRNDFSDPSGFFIGSHKGIIYDKPVIVLIDRGSYSATTMFAVAAKALPSVTLIGDTTGGGGGLPNGGQLPNGWTYRFSVSQLLDLDLNNYAELGVPPDIYAKFDWTNLKKDEIIERALLELK